jgi:hypothetical protein
MESTMVSRLALVSRIGTIEIEERDCETVTLWQLLKNIGTSARTENKFLGMCGVFECDFEASILSLFTG